MEVKTRKAKRRTVLKIDYISAVSDAQWRRFKNICQEDRILQKLIWELDKRMARHFIEDCGK